MKGSEILSHVDHTLLSPTATWEDICRVAEEAIACGCASLCIPPAYVARLHRKYGDRLNLCTVIGFPLGYDTTAAKIAAATTAVEEGANEIDMVINLGDVKNGDMGKVAEEIFMLKRAVGQKILKVIIETCYLNELEKIALCEAISASGADFIKTSTGFGPMGAKHSDIRLFTAHLGAGVRIKAAGGIRSIDDMKKYLAEGCDRLGCSAAVKLLRDKMDAEV